MGKIGAVSTLRIYFQDFFTFYICVINNSNLNKMIYNSLYVFSYSFYYIVSIWFGRL